MNELIGQHFIGNSFWNDEGVELVSIHDENGMWVLDCFESGSEEILKRINGYEQLQQSNKKMLDALKTLVTKYAYKDEYDSRFLNEDDQPPAIAKAIQAINNAEQRENE
ncbi:hypothetical protein [Methylophaga sp. OBS4]|uniref:hypothetical protein n=1 Tax=Methylophaga sp. OBS4 TaxID=2991935 RepID=UPI00224FD63E|nr:hypothetical protein [Methylophaga sp. OBS4]MCX4186730.1 hypothetical protein [Methylophaga sp. OBS4]